MKRSRVVSRNDRLPLSLGLVVGLALVAAASSSRASTQLWLYPEGVDPRAGGHVVATGTFTLLLENRGGGGGDATVHDAMLVFAVEDPALLGSASLLLPDGTGILIEPAALQLGSPVLPCSGLEFPPHGEYPAYFTTVPVGELGGGETLAIGVEIGGEDGLHAHFDAVGVGYRQTGQGMRCFDVSNPSGHDVTVMLGEVVPAPCEELSVDKTASATGVDLGDEVEYTLTVTNSGTCDLTQVVVVEDIPTITVDEPEVPAFTVVAAEPPATVQTPLGLEWHLGTLASGATVVISLTVVFDQPLADGRVVVNTVCASAAELEEPTCARARVAVGDVGDRVGGPGFWCNQIRFALEGRANAKFTVVELEAWLAQASALSRVFPELVDVTTLMLARDLICRPDRADSPADRLARHLLVLWFNVASERVDPATALGSLCPGSVPPPPGMDPGMTVDGLLTGAEDDLIAGADDGTLGFWVELVDFVNNSLPPGDPSCTGPRRGRGRL